MDMIKDKIPWFGGLTPTKLLVEMAELGTEEKEKGWDRETYKQQFELLLNKYGFRSRVDGDTFAEAEKIWKQYYTEADLPEE